MNEGRLERSHQRRKVMIEANLSTYEIVGQESPAIICLCCGFTSSSPNDVVQRYCAFCKAWHTELNGPDAFREFSDQWIEEVAWRSGYTKASERIRHMRDTLLGQITELEEKVRVLKERSHAL